MTRKFSEEAFLIVANKKRKIKPGTKNTDLEGMGPAEKLNPGGAGAQNTFRGPVKPTDGGKKKKKKKKKNVPY